MEEVPLIMMICIVLLIPYGVYQDWIKPQRHSSVIVTNGTNFRRVRS